MKVGDMVTLSRACLNRDTMWIWGEDANETTVGKPKPIGIITELRHGKIGWIGKEQQIYKIKWITSDAPKGREGNHGYMNTEFAGLFYRRDLKFISKRKVKKSA